MTNILIIPTGLGTYVICEPVPGSATPIQELTAEEIGQLSGGN